MNINHQGATINLQGLPYPVPAVRAADLRPGTVIVWNYGYTSTVVSVVPSATGKSLTLTTRSNGDGKNYTRRTTPDRLFGVRVA